MRFVATVEVLVDLTERAAEKIRELQATEPAGEAEVLRVAIQGGGCSGFQYGLGFDRGAVEGDHELELHGVRVVVDPFSAPYLTGSTIDWLDGLQESGFKIDNPQATVVVRVRPLVPGGGGRRARGDRRGRLRLRLLALTFSPPLIGVAYGLASLVRIA